jgi:hypothetical protein
MLKLNSMMSRRTKLDFKPLSLAETAKQLGIPRKRARRVLSLVGVEFEPGKARDVRVRAKARASKNSHG